MAEHVLVSAAGIITDELTENLPKEGPFEIVLTIDSKNTPKGIVYNLIQVAVSAYVIVWEPKP